MTLVALVITEASALSQESLDQATALVRAVADSCVLISEVSDSLLDLASFGLERSIRSQADNKSQSLFEQLDQLALDVPTLVVCVGPTTPITNYLIDRLGRTPNTVQQWEVVSSRFTRFALLDAQRDLSAFVPSDTKRWIVQLLERYGSQRVLGAPAALRGLTIGVLGESIIDEYVMCQALGKVSKDPLIAFQEQTREEQFGGVLAIARHLLGLGVLPTVFTAVSESDVEHMSVMGREKIHFGNSVICSGRPLVKCRFVDRASSARVFETYRFEAEPDAALYDVEMAKGLQNWSSPLIVVDYGHGLIGEQTLSAVNARQGTTAVNAQSNAGNRGFNPISRYRGADLTFLNGGEVEVETRRRATDLTHLIRALGNELGTSEFYVTNGSAGLVVWSSDEGTLHVPALAPSVVDRTGAGDALLATVAAMRFANIPVEIASFYGNIAGAIMCGSLGNKVSLSAVALQREARKLLNVGSE